jgi:hypothetical protein
MTHSACAPEGMTLCIHRRRKAARPGPARAEGPASIGLPAAPAPAGPAVTMVHPRACALRKAAWPGPAQLGGAGCPLAGRQARPQRGAGRSGAARRGAAQAQVGRRRWAGAGGQARRGRRGAAGAARLARRKRARGCTEGGREEGRERGAGAAPPPDQRSSECGQTKRPRALSQTNAVGRLRPKAAVKRACGQGNGQGNGRNGRRAGVPEQPTRPQRGGFSSASHPALGAHFSSRAGRATSPRPPPPASPPRPKPPPPPTHNPRSRRSLPPRWSWLGETGGGGWKEMRNR